MNLGKTYNQIMEDTTADYVAFLDHDAMFTTRDWYHQICEIIDLHPNAGVFTGITNRIGNRQQLVPEMQKHHDILVHREYGKRIQEEARHRVVPLEHTYGFKGEKTKTLHNGWRMLSGVLMVVNRKAWEEIKFQDGFLGVDGKFHTDLKNARWECLLMKGVYLYHFYRGDEDYSHLKESKLQFKPLQ